MSAIIEYAMILNYARRVPQIRATSCAWFPFLINEVWDLSFRSVLFLKKIFSPPRLGTEEGAAEEKKDHQHHFLWRRSGRRSWGWGGRRRGLPEDWWDEEESHCSCSEQCGGRDRPFRTSLLWLACPEWRGRARHSQLGGVPPCLPHASHNSASAAWQ